MRYVIDTSSLLALVRYYLPFDHEGILRRYLIDELSSGNIMLTKAILGECKIVSGGGIIKNLPELSDPDFLRAAKLPVDVDAGISVPPKKLTHWLNNGFVHQALKNKMNAEDFEIEKEKFTQSADLSLIILADALRSDGQDVSIISEETRNENDRKLYKKVPTLCAITGLSCMNLAEFLSHQKDLVITIHQRPTKVQGLF